MIDQIVVSTGAKQSIANVMLCLVNPGDEVIVPAPYWVSYREVVKLAEGTAVYVSSGIESNFKITAKQLEAAITPKTRVLIFSSPCNPTGSIDFSEVNIDIKSFFRTAISRSGIKSYQLYSVNIHNVSKINIYLSEKVNKKKYFWNFSFRNIF